MKTLMIAQLKLMQTILEYFVSSFVFILTTTILESYNRDCNLPPFKKLKVQRKGFKEKNIK